MPSISSGSNATFTVPSGYVIDVQCPGGWIQVEYPVGNKVFEGNPANRTFGPYTGGSQAKLTSVKGDIYYEVDARETQDVSGATILGKSIRRLNSGFRPLTVIPAGDSITAYNAAVTNGWWQWGGGYAEGSLMRTGRRFQLVRNAGVSGDTSAQLLARLQADVIAYAPDLCLLMIGTNDLISGMSNSAYTSMMNNIEQIVIRLMRAGITPIIVTPPPKNGAITEAKNAQWFYYALAQYYGLPLVDIYRALVNPQTGAYASGYNSDSTHPGPDGIAVMQSTVSAALANLDTLVCQPYLAAVSETSTGNFANMVRNGSFAYVTSSPTPDGWTVNTTNATQTIPSAAQPYTGNTFTYQKTLAGSLTALQGSGIPFTAFSIGDVIQFNVRLKVSGITPSTATGYQIITNDPANNQIRTNNWVQNGDFVLSAQAAITNASATMGLQLVVADAATYEINNWTVFNVTRANAIWQPGLQGL